MPELPDIVVYIEALERRVLGEQLIGVRIASPAVLRTFDPPYDAAVGSTVKTLQRVGKRIVFGFEADLFLVIHLMVAGRLRWETPRKPIPKKVGLAALDFEPGTLVLTEQGTHKRAGIWVIRGMDGVDALNRGGVEPLEVDAADFGKALRSENRTLKRALTDPRIFSGIGNAYSDEILWEARLSPVKRTAQMTEEEVARLQRRWSARWLLGPSGCGPRWGRAGRPRSPPFGMTWRCTGSSGSHVLAVGHRCRESSMPATRPTTARPAKPEGSCWPTARCPVCSRPTGRKPWRI